MWVDYGLCTPDTIKKYIFDTFGALEPCVGEHRIYARLSRSFQGFTGLFLASAQLRVIFFEIFRGQNYSKILLFSKTRSEAVSNFFRLTFSFNGLMISWTFRVIQRDNTFYLYLYSEGSELEHRLEQCDPRGWQKEEEHRVSVQPAIIVTSVKARSVYRKTEKQRQWRNPAPKKIIRVYDNFSAIIYIYKPLFLAKFREKEFTTVRITIKYVT